MAVNLETLTSHIMSFEDDEITVIINSLYATGNNELAEEIWDELYGDDECECEYSKRLMQSIEEINNSHRVVRINLDGPDWAKDLVASTIESITKNVK